MRIYPEEFDKPGIEISKLLNGTKLIVATRNNTYTFNKVDKDCLEAQGGKYLPDVQKVTLNGSTFRGSAIKVGCIALGMNMEICISQDLTITTSKVQKIRIEGDDWHYSL